MEILIVGLSSIVTRRVLPALRSLSQVGRIDVATNKGADPAVRGMWTHGKVYDEYATAIRNTPAELVYVSLVNSEHERWARAALEAGKHVVVDKPAFLSCDGANRMVEFATKQGLCVAEATVFGYHPQLSTAQKLFDDSGSGPLRISMALCFPPMDPGNFRYKASLGGGALWDVGPYLAATSRLFFKAEPLTADCRILANRDGVETAFSAMGVFTGERSLTGQFGFDTAYLNRLQLIGPSLVVEIDRAFTTPADYANTIRVSGAGGPFTVEERPADAFAAFFGHVIGRLESREWGSLASDLLTDARVLHAYREAAQAS